MNHSRCRGGWQSSSLSGITPGLSIVGSDDSTLVVVGRFRRQLSSTPPYELSHRGTQNVFRVSGRPSDERHNPDPSEGLGKSRARWCAPLPVTLTKSLSNLWDAFWGNGRRD